VFGEDLVGEDGSTISATRIRGLLRSGELGEANKLLGRCHVLRGAVEHGRGEGTGMGFPTANVSFAIEDCMPKEGVYAGYVVVDGTAWASAINVGAPPTFSDARPAFLEANLLGFSGDLYGREVSVVFARWLRASRPFPSTEELERAVLSNVDWVRTQVGQHGVEVGE
jgi:riboflavin kinase/FMN adenylyltransferase